LFRKFFVAGLTPALTADLIRDFYHHKDFSLRGSNQWHGEKSAYMNILSFIDDCQDISCAVTLSDILSFVTGSAHMPAIGFPHDGTVEFTTVGRYPTVSTCTLTLILPIGYQTYEDFRQDFIEAIQGHNGYGRT
jgi:hypothetical protein